MPFWQQAAESLRIIIATGSDSAAGAPPAAAGAAVVIAQPDRLRHRQTSAKTGSSSGDNPPDWGGASFSASAASNCVYCFRSPNDAHTTRRDPAAPEPPPAATGLCR